MLTRVRTIPNWSQDRTSRTADVTLPSQGRCALCGLAQSTTAIASISSIRSSCTSAVVPTSVLAGWWRAEVALADRAQCLHLVAGQVAHVDVHLDDVMELRAAGGQRDAQIAQHLLGLARQRSARPPCRLASMATWPDTYSVRRSRR